MRELSSAIGQMPHVSPGQMTYRYPGQMTRSFTVLDHQNVSADRP